MCQFFALLLSCCSVAGWANELMGGVSYIEFIRQLSNRLPSDWSQVLQQLEAIWHVLGRGRECTGCASVTGAAHWDSEATVCSCLYYNSLRCVAALS